jgi:cell division inhibitor SepF
MAFLNRLMGMMHLTEDDDDYDDDSYDDEELDEEPEKPRRNVFVAKRQEDSRAQEPAREQSKAQSRFLPKSQNSKVVPMRHGSMELSMVKPTNMEDAREIAELLLEGKAVVLNMEGMRIEVAQRIIDFTCGSTFSINGNLQKISNYIFIATPANVELTGDFPEALADGTIDISRMNVHY